MSGHRNLKNDIVELENEARQLDEEDKKLDRKAKRLIPVIKEGVSEQKTYVMLRKWIRDTHPKANTNKVSLAQLLKVYNRGTKSRNMSVSIKYEAKNLQYVSAASSNDAGDEETKEQLKGRCTKKIRAEDLDNENLIIGFILTDINSKFGKHQIRVLDTTISYVVDTSGASKYNRLKFKGEALRSRIFETVNCGIRDDNREGFCLVQSIYNQLAAQKDFKRLTFKKLCEQCSEVTCCQLDRGMSIEHIKELQKKYYRYTNFYVMDALQHMKRLEAPDAAHAKSSVCLRLTNGHAVGIYNESVRHDIIRKKRCDLFKIECDLETDNYVMFTPAMFDDLVAGKVERHVIMSEDSDMMLFMGHIIDTTGYNIELFDYRTQSIVSCFVHPVSQKMVIENNKFEMRKSICAKAFELFKSEDFVFRNQSITNIAMGLFKHSVGKLQKSSYNQLMLEVLDEYTPSAITEGYATTFDAEKSVGFDIFKCYSSVLALNDLNVPVFNVLCDLVDYDGRDIECGEYLLDTVEFTQWGFVLPSRMWSWNLVKWLIDEGLMDKSKIKKMLLPCGEIPADAFSEFVKFVYKQFNESEGKSIVNMFIGNMGTKYNKEMKGCIVTDLTEARSLQALYENVDIYDFRGDRFLVKQTAKCRLLEDNTSINRFVISGGVRKVIETLRKVMGEKSKLLSIRTDCVYVENPVTGFPVGEKPCAGNSVHEKPCLGYPSCEKPSQGIPSVAGNSAAFVDVSAPVVDNLGKMKMEREIHLVQVHEENNDEDDFSVEASLEEIKKCLHQGNGQFIAGIGGSGKTHTAIEEFLKHPDEKKIMMSFTNKACSVVRERLKAKGADEGLVSTLCSFCLENPTSDTNASLADIVDKLAKLDLVWIDETSNCPMRFFKMLYMAWLKKKNEGGDLRVILSGDVYQTPSTDTREKKYDVTQCGAIKQMCPTFVTLPYREESGRYDKRAHHIIESFLKYRNLRWIDFPSPVLSEYNISKLNETRKEVNQKMNEGRQGTKLTFKYQGKSEEYTVYKGMRLVCTTNLKQHEMWNSETYALEEVRGDGCVINGKTFSKADVCKSFLPAYCSTVIRYQGDCIDSHYNILDVNKMSANELYTALSRTTKGEYIHLDKSQLRKWYWFHDYSREKNIVYKPIKGGKYGESKIYEVSVDGKLYIGSTTKEKVEERLAEHLADEHSPLYGLNHAVIKEVVQVLCFSRAELEEVERRYVEEYVAKYGAHLMLNTNLMPVVKEAKEPRLIFKKEEGQENKRFSIVDDEKQSCFRIQWRENGIKNSIKRRYKSENKEAVYKTIQAERERLIAANE